MKILYLIAGLAFVVIVSHALSIRTGLAMFGNEQAPLLFAGFLMGILVGGLKDKD